MSQNYHSYKTFPEKVIFPCENYNIPNKPSSGCVENRWCHFPFSFSEKSIKCLNMTINVSKSLPLTEELIVASLAMFGENAGEKIDKIDDVLNLLIGFSLF